VRLITAHRILIAAGIAFFVFYAVFQLRLYVREGAVGSVAQAVAAAIIAAGFVWYYRSLRGR
jgi:hypothetical protein